MTKFKVGDWVQHQDGRTGRILEIDKNGFDVFCVFPSCVGSFYSGYGCCLPIHLTMLYPKFDRFREFFSDFLPVRKEKVDEPKFEVGETVFVLDRSDNESSPHKDIVKKIYKTTQGNLYALEDFIRDIYREIELTGLVKDSIPIPSSIFRVGDIVIFDGAVSGRMVVVIDEIDDGHYWVIGKTAPFTPFDAFPNQLYALNDISVFRNGDKVRVTDHKFIGKGEILTIKRPFKDPSVIELIGKDNVVYCLGTDTSGLQLILDP